MQDKGWTNKEIAFAVIVITLTIGAPAVMLVVMEILKACGVTF